MQDCPAVLIILELNIPAMPPARCLYDELGLTRDAGDEDIKYAPLSPELVYFEMVLLRISP